MRWPVVVLLLLFGIGGLVADEADETVGPAAPAVSGHALPQQPAPHPIPAATVSRNDGAADRIDHLHKAAEHLEAAGMKSLADHVRGLAVARGDRKSSQEGESATPEQQVLLRFALLEIDEARLRQAGFDFSPNQPVIRVPDRNALVDGLRQNGLVRVLAEPTLVTTIGRPARFLSGCEVPGWTIGPDGTPVSSPAHCGTRIDVVPQLTDQGDLRIQVRMEYSEVDHGKTVRVAGKEIPAIRKATVSTTLEMKRGQTIALSGLRRAVDDGKSGAVAKIMILTAEAVESMAAGSPSNRPR
jgi:hypothetical protein